MSAAECPVRLGVLVSGGGTTLENLLARKNSQQLSIEISIVIADRPCRGLEIAERAGIATALIARPKQTAPSAEWQAWNDRLDTALREHHVDLVVLGGFLSRIRVPRDFQGRILNIHPSLIPAFCGEGFFGHRVHEAVLARGCQVSGCTVHFVDDEFDHGPIILQRVVPVLEGDTVESLAARVFRAECDAYPAAIRKIADRLRKGCTEENKSNRPFASF